MDFLLFQLLPYFAVLVMIGGGIYRIVTIPYTVSSKSSQFLEPGGMKLGSNLFHIGVIVILLGHFVGLFTPVSVLDRFNMAYSEKQMLAVVIGGVAAVLAVIGLAILIIRREGKQRVSSTSNFGDKFVLYLIMAQLIVGIISIKTSLEHTDGSAMLTFMSWANALARFDSDAYMIVKGVGPVFKLHFILGIMIFAALPFTRLIHIFRIPLLYVFRPYLLIRRKI